MLNSVYQCFLTICVFILSMNSTEMTRVHPLHLMLAPLSESVSTVVEASLCDVTRALIPP